MDKRFEHHISIMDKNGKEVAYVSSDPANLGPIVEADRAIDILLLAKAFLPKEGQPYSHTFISRRMDK